MNYKVTVLMSTYNGEKYLREQMDSILGQSFPVKILVRGDGSTDQTVKILEEYKSTYTNFDFILGKNLGVQQSFFELLMEAPESDFYAFADQDDVWDKVKIQRAIEKICDKRGPCLYCSNTIIVDENLNVIKKEKRQVSVSFGNALVQNVCAGCTAVINKELREIINRVRPKKVIMHDWWMYLVAETFGQTLYDEDAYIKYRQHGGNVWGLKLKKSEILRYRLRQVFLKRGDVYRQLEELNNGYLEISEEKRLLINLILASENSMLKRLELVRNKEIYRVGDENKDDLVYRIAAIMGKL